MGVSRTASADEIKRAYRKMAMQHHPDRGGDVNRFQEIEEAYRVLSDPQQRQQYDNPRPSAQSFTMNMGPGMFNLDEIFNMFGTNMRGNRGMSQRLSLWIGLSDVARGGPRIISLNTHAGISSVEIDIPPGIGDGDTIRYPKASPDGQDLVITYRIHPDERWQRDGRDLTMTMTVDIWDLILGAEVPVTDIHNVTLMLTVPARTQPGSLLRLRGRGLPDNSLPGRGRNLPPGDLLVRVQARIPDNISPALLEAITRDRGQ